MILLLLCASAVIGCCFAENTATPPRIKHIVVLMMENRPFDHMFGWATKLLGVNGLTGEEYNLVDPADPNSEKVYVSDKAPFLNDCDPNHGVPATTSKLFSTSASQLSGIPDMGGFVAFENSSTALNYCNVMEGFSPSRVPVITSLAQNFAIMDRIFASVPGPTWPNRMFALSGTSAGSTSTSIWYHNDPGKLYPQRTFYDQIEESGNTWKNYFNDTPWELILEKVAHSPHNLHPLDQFYADAEAGTLPSFSWINPRSGMNITTGVGSNDQHPDHDVSAGEQYYKDIYEALRASPSWQDTLYIVTYDEHGGFFDHSVPPSLDIPPPNDGEASYPDIGFKFDRLGVRVPTLLISPWIKAGTVLSNPPSSGMPASNSEYDLTSIIATARKLLPGMENVGPLTSRDAWSATFEHLLYELDQPRTDCPLHLPDALAPALPSATVTPESELPINDLQKDISNVHSFLGHGEKAPELQGALSEWLVRQHSAHKSKTTDWLDSKASPNATVTIKPRPDYKGSLEDAAWDMNGLPFGSVSGQYANSKSPYIVLSTRTLRRTTSKGTEEPFCLDAGEGKQGSRLKATACYPSQDPNLNRDPMQHFVLHSDGTLRLFDPKDSKGTLCVTNHLFDKYERRGLKVDAALKARVLKSDYTDAQEVVTLEVCNDRVQQTFAYHGHAPGDNGSGNLEFGDVEFYLGVVKAAA